MFKDGQEARVAYPVEGLPEARCLPGGEIAGRSFHNGCFVQRLRQAAASCPGIALRQASVRRLLNGKSTLLVASPYALHHHGKNVFYVLAYL